MDSTKAWGVPIEKVSSAQDKNSLWKDAGAHPLVLLLMVLDLYKDESMSWDPAVLRVTLMRDGFQLSGANWTKILAARCAAHSPSPYLRWEVFAWTALGLSGVQPNITYLEVPSIANLMLCADILHVVDPLRPYSVEVQKFVAAALKNEGHVIAPEMLSFAQHALTDPHIRCETCGAVHNDDNDEKCITCGAKTLAKVPDPFGDLRAECTSLWARFKDQKVEDLDKIPETPAGNLVYQLCLAWDYARRMRHSLLQQLRALSK